MLRSMRPFIVSTAIVPGAALAVLPAVAHQDVALKDLMPKRIVIGVTIDPRRFERVDTAAVDITTKQINAWMNAR
jgi:hypothetical protein